MAGRTPPSVSVTISEEFFATKNLDGAGLLDAMREAGRARGFSPADTPSNATAQLTSLPGPQAGARVRADLDDHAQPIATAAARAMGVPVTLVIVAGTATGQKGRLSVSLTARAMQIDRTGKARTLRLDPAETPEHVQQDAADWTQREELLRAGRDHAEQVLAGVLEQLDLPLATEGDTTTYGLLRPTGSHRVEEIASLIAVAAGHELVKQADGRVLVRITLGDGKRMAFLSAEEAAELRERL